MDDLELSKLEVKAVGRSVLIRRDEQVMRAGYWAHCSLGLAVPWDVIYLDWKI